MRLLGNVIWLVFGGFFAGLGYIIGGLSLCLTIIGIPFGIQTIKIGIATMTPFGREIVEIENSNETLALIFNVIWVVLLGWEIAIAHLVSAAILVISIIGIPFAAQHMKLLSLSIWPFGRTLR